MAIASRFWTYLELKTKVEQECDLEGEIFVQPSEMLGFCNEAIDNAEKIVKNTYADYFLDKDQLALTAGSSDVALPSRIYANKIRRITYKNTSGRIYTLSRLKDWKKFEAYEEEQAAGGTAGELRYLILNQTAGAPKIVFTRPASAEDAAATVTCWFIRQANRLTVDADIMDIPEAANYVTQYMKFKAFAKEGNPLLGLVVSQLNSEEESLQADLAEMVPDADDELEMDKSFYEDMA